MDVQQFVAKWRAARGDEMREYQGHVQDICALVNHWVPYDQFEDRHGERFTYQKRSGRIGGQPGFADVWLKDHFAIEYKSKGKDLEEAYVQLLRYRDFLDNPPLLIVCDFETIVIRTNFTGRTTRVIRITLDDLAAGTLLPDINRAPLDVLRRCFFEPESLVPEETTAKLTEDVARHFEVLALTLRDRWGHSDMAVARFISKVVFCMFASDVGLLPANVITQLVDSYKSTSGKFAAALSQLFATMNTGGGYGAAVLPHFNGGLFDDPVALSVDWDSMKALRDADQYNWADVEPSVFGTLFERIIDEKKRSQLGKHYTSRADIETLVEPVILWPLRREWEAVTEEVDALMAADPEANREHASRLLGAFVDRLASVRVLDPACGSGNFLYIALEKLKELELAVHSRALTWSLLPPNYRVHPRQLYGIEINEYAHQLASTVVWIGYLQWKRKNGLALDDEEPILQPLDNIQQMDAIVSVGVDGSVSEPVWPVADFIVGNPPFLGGKKLLRELGPKYTAQLRALYANRVLPFGDLCCYWFEKARGALEHHGETRVGLIATQSIRGGASRNQLERIKATGDIFFAWSDRPWVLDGASVHVSLVGFDNGSEPSRMLDGIPVPIIHSDLTHEADTTTASRLVENRALSFIGVQKSGPFDITEQEARRLLRQPNPNRRSNDSVVRRVVNGDEVVGEPENRWIIDFGTHTPMEEAATFADPFKIVLDRVKPMRDDVNRKAHRERWWLFGDARPGMRRALRPLARQLVTPMTAKHRVFRWLPTTWLCDNSCVVFARDDDYFFGVLHSRIHEVWSRRKATQVREAASGTRYTPTTTFETFPMPWPPGREPDNDPRIEAIAVAARELNDLRENWLNPPGLDEDDLKKRTLTKLYNERPTWLDLAHEKLDAAVFAAYDWPADLGNADILARLLALNHERAKENGAVERINTARGEVPSSG